MQKSFCLAALTALALISQLPLALAQGTQTGTQTPAAQSTGTSNTSDFASSVSSITARTRSGW